MTAFPPRPVPWPPAPWTFPAVETTAHPNGLTLVTCELPGRGLTAVQLVIDAGAGREPPELDGIATITARALVEAGTDKRPARSFAADLEHVGATLRAQVNVAALRLVLDAPASRLATALDLLAEAVHQPAFPAADVDRLVDERLAEIKIEDANPRTRARRELHAIVLAPGERAARPVGGGAQSVAGLDAATARAYATAAIGPGAATCVVAGDQAEADIERLVADAFARWTGKPPAPAPEPPRFADGPRLVIVNRPGAKQTRLALGHGLPGREHGDWAGLTVAAHVLGGGLTSRLDAVLREQKGYTYGFRAAAQPMRRGGILVLEGAVASAATAAALADVISETERLRTAGVTPDEFAAAIRKLADGAPVRWDTARAIASELARSVAGDRPADYPARHLAELRSLAVEDVVDVITRRLNTADLGIVAVGDADRIHRPLERLGIAPVEVVS